MALSVDSSKATSDELRKQIMEQTSTLAEAPPEEELTESEETVEVELPEEESKVETAEEKAETPEEKPIEEKKPRKIMVEGEEITEEKLKKYSQEYQQLRFQERKAEREKLKQQPAQPQIQMPSDLTKVNEQFVESLQKDTFGTMVQFYKTARELEKQQERAERRADLEFELDKRELPHYQGVKSSYDDYRDQGMDREHAWDRAEKEFWMAQYAKAKETGMTEGTKKTKLQQKAQIAVGEKRVRKEGSLPSPEEARKMTSDQLAKYLKRVKVDW